METEGKHHGLADAVPRSDGSTLSRREWTQAQQVTNLVAILRPSLGIARSRRTARRLIEHFGSIPEALAAPHTRLLEIDGIGPATARLLRATMRVAENVARRRVRPGRPVLNSLAEVIDYCHVQMAYQSIEQARVLFLDGAGRLIADEVMQTGTVDRTQVYPREIVKRSIELSATGLVLIHNHPSGSANPSSVDVRSTHEIMAVANVLGIRLCDHIIIGKYGHLSMHRAGLLADNVLHNRGLAPGLPPLHLPPLATKDDDSS